MKKSTTANFTFTCFPADVHAFPSPYLRVCMTQEGNRYASFETNSRQTDYTQMIESILSVFRPRKFTMVRWRTMQAMSELLASDAFFADSFCRKDRI